MLPLVGTDEGMTVGVNDGEPPAVGVIEALVFPVGLNDGPEVVGATVGKVDGTPVGIIVGDMDTVGDIVTSVLPSSSRHVVEPSTLDGVSQGRHSTLAPVILPTPGLYFPGPHPIPSHPYEFGFSPFMTRKSQSFVGMVPVSPTSSIRKISSGRLP